MDGDKSPPEFIAQLRVIYLEIGNQLFKIQCIEDTGAMRIEPCIEISNSPYLDDDFKHGTMSIRELILDDPDAENKIKTIRLWSASFDDEEVVCSASQLELGNGQVLFIDPSNHFGIRIGGSRQKSRWFENWPDATSAVEWSTSLEE